MNPESIPGPSVTTEGETKQEPNVTMMYASVTVMGIDYPEGDSRRGMAVQGREVNPVTYHYLKHLLEQSYKSAVEEFFKRFRSATSDWQELGLRSFDVVALPATIKDIEALTGFDVVFEHTDVGYSSRVHLYAFGDYSKPVAVFVSTYDPR